MHVRAICKWASSSQSWRKVPDSWAVRAAILLPLLSRRHHTLHSCQDPQKGVKHAHPVGGGAGQGVRHTAGGVRRREHGCHAAAAGEECLPAGVLVWRRCIRQQLMCAGVNGTLYCKCSRNVWVIVRQQGACSAGGRAAAPLEVAQCRRLSLNTQHTMVGQS